MAGHACHRTQDQDDDAVVVDRMKKRVYALSREVASLTRERDDLLTRLMDSSLAGSDVQVFCPVAGAAF